jgi:hypothetical protein
LKQRALAQAAACKAMRRRKTRRRAILNSLSINLAQEISPRHSLHGGEHWRADRLVNDRFATACGGGPTGRR